jgi:gliding motility-associated-like protein
MKKVLSFILFLITVNVYGQRQTDNWYFGLFDGLNFSTNPPTILTGVNPLFINEGCALISDRITGQMLFYTDGQHVGNKNFQPMLGTVTSIVAGGISSTESSVIVPMPGDTNIYYLFTTPAIEDWCPIMVSPAAAGPSNMSYIKVDMSYNNGTGALVGPNVPIMDSSTEKLAAVGYCNGNYWIVGHKFNSDTFYSFKLTSAGLSAPVKSKVGVVHTSTYAENGTAARGYMKFSPDGKKIGLVITHPSTMEIFDFDENTGVISNPITEIDPNSVMQSLVMGCSFSPDDSKFYAQREGGGIYQYDLNAGNPAAVLASKTWVGSGSIMQTGKNGKIYCLGPLNALSVINNPNLLSAACDFEYGVQPLSGNTLSSIPNFVENFAASKYYVPFVVPSHLQMCMGDTLLAPQPAGTGFIIQPNQGWSANAENTLYQFFPQDTITYTIIRPGSTCYPGDTIKLTINVIQPPVIHFDYTMLSGCKGDTVSFHNTTTDATHYAWDFNDGFNSTAFNPIHTFLSQGVYQVKLIAYDANNCKSILTKPVTIEPFLHAAFTPSDTLICAGSAVSFLNTSVAQTINNIDPAYNWSFGDGHHSSLPDPSNIYTNAGKYPVVLVATNGLACFDSAFAFITVDTAPVLHFTHTDTAICMGESIAFAATYTQVGLTSLLWNFGDNGDQLTGNTPKHAYDAPGVYKVLVSGHYRACPAISDSVAITIKTLPVINLGPDTAICIDADPITLSDSINANNPKATWLWSTGATTPAVDIRHDGLYTATVTIDQCSESDQIWVKKDCYIDIPNAFTPDNDGVNDYFFPRQLLSNGVATFIMSVFDRWGQKVFQTKSIDGRGWDGRFNNKNQPEGVYIYDIQLQQQNGKAEHYTGNVTLIR